MSGKLLSPLIYKNRTFGCSISLLKYCRRQLTTNNSNNKNDTKSSCDEKLAVKKDQSTKPTTTQSTFVQIKQIPVKFDKYVRKMQGEEDDEEENKKEERKGPFKNYFEEEERNKKTIMFYEEYFDKNTREKNRENFMTAVEAFKITNPTKQLYIDFVYGALLKMKEFNCHNHLEAYRKILEVFPIGPLRSESKWARDNFHHPRQQNCALAVLEQMERNGVMPDENLVRLAIDIFGDWTHVVRKAKRQLYWMPKFKNANPYPVPSNPKLEKMSKLELAIAALERMCVSADSTTKICVEYTKELNDERDPNDDSKWIVTAQSDLQIDLLKNHKKSVPIYVEGPHYTWLRNYMVEYFIMRTDPLPETLEKIEIIKNLSEKEDDVTNMHNPFDDPFKKKKKESTALVKMPYMSVHELAEGTIYAMCCTESSSKNSLYNWTKLLERKHETLKDFVVIYKYIEKSSKLVDLDKSKDEETKKNAQS